MKKIVLILCLGMSNIVLANDLDGTFASYVHAKCSTSGVDATLVLENKSPYEISVKKNSLLNESVISGELFSVFNAELLRAYKAGTGPSSNVLLDKKKDRLTHIEQKEVLFKPFEKKYWTYKNINELYHLESQVDYILTVRFTGLHIVYGDGVEEYSILDSKGFLLPKCEK